MEKEETKVEEARKGTYSDQGDLNKKRWISTICVEVK